MQVKELWQKVLPLLFNSYGWQHDRRYTSPAGPGLYAQTQSMILLRLLELSSSYTDRSVNTSNLSVLWSLAKSRLFQLAFLFFQLFFIERTCSFLYLVQETITIVLSDVQFLTVLSCNPCGRLYSIKFSSYTFTVFFFFFFTVVDVQFIF